MHQLTNEYNESWKKYEVFKEKIEGLIKELLSENKIGYHKIEARIKDPKKLDEKIIRKDNKYQNLSDITDLIGIRIITYFDDEIDKIAKIINSEFTVDSKHSTDKRNLDADRFGYKSLHFVISLNDYRAKLTEYSTFKDFKVEIQLRSILQHAWAEIEHDLGYKNEQIIPDNIKRNFFRVAALLETADIEFVNIKKELAKYEKIVTQDIKSHPEKVSVNGPSILAFLNSNELANQLDKEIAKILKEKLFEADLLSISPIIEMLHYLEISTIDVLEKNLLQNKESIIPFMKKWVKNDMIGPIKRGLSLFYLCYIIVARRNDPAFSQAYYNNFFSGGIKNRASEITEIYYTL